MTLVSQLPDAHSQVDEAAVRSYCHRLNSVLDLSGEVDRRLLESLQEFKELRPDRFREIASVHLSFLLDLPHFDDEGAGGRRQSKRSGGCRRQLPLLLTAGRRKGRSAKPAALSHVAVDRIARLMSYLLENDRFRTEGIFRKTGNCGRQKELRRQLLANAACDLADFTVHDVANVMKILLRSLEEPLLGDRLIDVLTAVADLNGPARSEKSSSSERNECEEQIRRCRQLKAVRIVAQLIPQRAMAFLTRILHFLHIVGSCRETKMDFANLGTVFGPVLFCSKSVEAATYHRRVESLNSISAFLIANCYRINEVPRAFAEDLHKNLQKNLAKAAGTPPLSTGASGHGAQSATPLRRVPCSFGQLLNSPDDAVDTSVRFSERRAQPSSSVYGEQQLASLYAHIRHLPESKEKRRLEKRFNQRALCCSPEAHMSFRRRLCGSRSCSRLAAGSNGGASISGSSNSSSSGSSRREPQRTAGSRLFGRDRRLGRALSSLRAHRCRCGHDLGRARAKLDFDECPASDSRRQQQQQQQPQQQQPESKRLRLGMRSSSGRLRISSPKLVFSDAAQSPASAAAPRLLRAHFLETAL